MSLTLAIPLSDGATLPIGAYGRATTLPRVSMLYPVA